MWAIFKREFKNFFQNVIGWVFIASMVFVSALYFNAYNINAGMSDILYVLVRLLMIMIFSLPVLSMRILSEATSSAVSQYAFTHLFYFFSLFAPKQVSYTLPSLGLLRGETFFPLQ